MKELKTNLQFSVQRLQPCDAQELLNTVTRNRKKKNSHVQRFAEAMKRGEWVVGAPILIDNEGKLFDGQHRMASVIRAKRAIDFAIIKGYKRATTFAKIDDVARRNLPDWLHMNGEERPQELSVIIRASWLRSLGANPFASHGGSAYHKFTPITGIDHLAEHPELRETVEMMPVRRSTLLKNEVSYYLFHMLRQADESLAKDFFLVLLLENEAIEGDPIYVLREKLKSYRQMKVQPRKMEAAALVILAWNAVYEGRKIDKLEWIEKGPHGSPFPQISGSGPVVVRRKRGD